MRFKKGAIKKWDSEENLAKKVKFEHVLKENFLYSAFLIISYRSICFNLRIKSLKNYNYNSLNNFNYMFFEIV